MKQHTSAPDMALYCRALVDCNVGCWVKWRCSIKITLGLLIV